MLSAVVVAVCCWWMIVDVIGRIDREWRGLI